MKFPVFSMVLAAVPVFLAAGLNLAVPGRAVAHPAAEKVLRDIAVGPNITTICIRNRRGTVHLVGWDKPRLNVTGLLDEQALALDIRVDNQVMLVNVALPPHVAPVAGSQLTLHLPRRVLTRVSGVSTRWIAQNTGSLSVISMSGPVEIKHALGELTVDVISAPVSVSGAAKNVQVRGMSGSLSLAGISGRVDASTVTGSLKLEQPTLRMVRLSSINGRIDLIGRLAADAAVTLNSVRGDQNLRLAQNSDARAEIEVLDGGMIRDQRRAPTGARQQKPHKTLQFTLGDGRGRFKAVTVSGRITLKPGGTVK